MIPVFIVFFMFNVHGRDVVLSLIRILYRR